MLAVNSEHLPSPMQQSSQGYEQEPSLTEPEMPLPKQQTKTKLFTPLNIMIILLSIALIGMGGYYLFSLGETTDMKSMINESNANIKAVADSSSSQKDGSSTGSDSSKSSSTNNNKPNAKSQPASKSIISSNKKLTGAGDDEDDEGSDKQGRNSGGGSTEIDSQDDSEEEDSDDEANNEPIVWVDKNAPASQGATPMVGSARDGGR